MLPQRELLRMLWALVMSGVLITPVSGGPSCSSNEDLIDQARSEYYNLTKRGLKSFKATIEPNWEVTLGPTATKENLKVFHALQFSMTFDANGAVTVSNTVVKTQKPRTQPFITPVHDNMQGLVASFFGTWSMFVVRSPFPETGSPMKIENSREEYRVFNPTQSGDVMLTMTKEFLITDWKVTGPRGTGTVKPLFQRVDDGLLLTGYQSFFEPTSEGLRTTMKISIEYQDVSGMKLPHTVRFSGMHGSEPVDAELTFNKYVLNPPG